MPQGNTSRRIRASFAKQSRPNAISTGDVRISKSTTTIDGNQVTTIRVDSRRETIAITKRDDEGIETRITKRLVMQKLITRYDDRAAEKRV